MVWLVGEGGGIIPPAPSLKDMGGNDVTVIYPY